MLKHLKNKIIYYLANQCPFDCYYEGRHPACTSKACSFLKLLNLEYGFGRFHKESTSVRVCKARIVKKK